MNKQLQDAYRYWRNVYSLPFSTPCRANEALRRAKQDVAENVTRYPHTIAHGQQLGDAMENGMQWCNPDQFGLRFVGWSNDLQERNRNTNFGWYTNDNYDESLRGCVYQLPARKGKAIFLPAYREGSTSKNWKDWTDTCGEHSAAIHFHSVFSYVDADEAKKDASRCADQFAERAAEKEREYNEAWQSGSRWQSLGEEISAHRKGAIALIKEMRNTRRAWDKPEGDIPTICATLRAHVISHMHDIETARNERAEICSHIWREHYSAFNEGAGKPILS